VWVGAEFSADGEGRVRYPDCEARLSSSTRLFDSSRWLRLILPHGLQLEGKGMDRSHNPARLPLRRGLGCRNDQRPNGQED
jgi:hypothetical protein